MNCELFGRVIVGAEQQQHRAVEAQQGMRHGRLKGQLRASASGSGGVGRTKCLGKFAGQLRHGAPANAATNQLGPERRLQQAAQVVVLHMGAGQCGL